MPENAEAYQVWSIVNEQHIMGFNGPVEINLDPVFRVMDMLKVADQERCLELIRIVYHKRLKKKMAER